MVFYGGLESWIGKMIISGEPEERILEMHEMLQEIFPEKCYLEIIAQDEELFSELPKVNQLLLHLARKTDTPCIVSNTYYYPEPKDKSIWEMALAIKDNVKIYDPSRRQPSGQYHIMTADEIREICLKNGYKAEQIEERLKTTLSIGEQTHTSLKFGQTLFPKYEASDLIKELYTQHKDTLILPLEET
ncbi:MAG: hypothetical protein LBP53_01485 [Candidatus Peribacteria bacterium]|nr:hypothetical protein [Candidatus Peribacteria bacterium]